MAKTDIIVEKINTKQTLLLKCRFTQPLNKCLIAAEMTTLLFFLDHFSLRKRLHKKLNQIK